jgi:hypothetical protein
LPRRKHGFWLAQAVAQAAHGLDNPTAQFAAQMVNMDIERITLYVIA